MRIVETRVNHLSDPLGFELHSPVFSWKVEGARGTRQKEARVQIAMEDTMDNPVWDTGWDAGLDSLHVPCDLALSPCTRYFWRAGVRSDRDEEAWSATAFFETAKMDEPFEAEWIGCGDAPRHPVFARTVPAFPDIRSARLYITGLGLYRAMFNGKAVTNEVLTPYCNAYDHWVQYQTYDVTEQVRQGGTLQVVLGNGWYKGRFGFADKTGKGFYGDDWKLLAEIRVTRGDGSVVKIGTDDSWVFSDSTVTFSNIYDGEVRDDTLEETEFRRAERCEPPRGRLTARYSLPVVTQKELPVKEIIHTPKGETVLDLGQEITGGFRLRVRAPRGTRIHLQFGEILQQGCFYRDNLRSARAEYWYTAPGGTAVIEPLFTFYGYRYVKIEGMEVRQDDFTGLCWWSQMEKTGTLTTGHGKINRLIANTEWGHLDNFLDVPTDCPQRDERMGWTGDAEVFAPTACFLRDTYAFYRKYLHDMALEQEARGGAVPDVVPAFGHQGVACAWADATTIIPMALYGVYGDRRVLEEHYGAMRAWSDWLIGQEADGHAWRSRFHYGDWLALDAPDNVHYGVENTRGATGEDYLASVYMAVSLSLTARAAGILGLEEDRKTYEAAERKVREEIARDYYDADGRCRISTQTAHLLTLRHRLGPCPDSSAPELVRLLEENGGRLTTGFIGTPILLEELTRIGRADLAYSLLFHEGYPGWLYEVNLGATTVWERWNSVLEDGSLSSTGMNSLNHYAYGSVVQWMYERMAGLRSEKEGFRVCRIEPAVDERLGYVRCHYDSPSGMWTVSWEIVDGRKIHVHVAIPFGCEAHIRLPRTRMQEETLCAGEYDWTYPMS